MADVRSPSRPAVLSRGHWIVFAHAVALAGGLIPAWSVYELYQLPLGTAIRPMHLPILLVFFGLGTPVLVGTFLWIGYQNTVQGTDRASRLAPLTYLASILALLNAFIPMALLTLVVRWVATTRELTFLP